MEMTNQLNRTANAEMKLQPKQVGNGERFLGRTAVLWCAIVLVGQSIFFYYIARFYGVAAVLGEFQVWAKNTHLIKGYVIGDASGNAIFGVHAVLASVVAFCGVLQLLPQLRTRLPGFHRWNGRLFLVAMFAATMAGFVLVWVRGTYLNLVGAWAVTINGILIIVCGVLAWRKVREKDFASHRRWALRTFVVANGVWFQRLGYFTWFLVLQAPVGVTKRMDGAFDLVWAFGCYLLPFAVMELYLRAKQSTNRQLKLIAGGVLFGFSSLMLVGIVALAMIFWLPLLAKL
jgi:hypothetical protein